MKQFKCPECGGDGYSLSTQLYVYGHALRYCDDCNCTFAWPHKDDAKYLTDLPDEPPRPTEDELMRVAPGWEVDRYDYPQRNDLLILSLDFCTTWIFGEAGVKKFWILRKRPDWAYYQRDLAEKWLADNRPDLKIVGLRKIHNAERNKVIGNAGDGSFNYIIKPDCLSDFWRWVVEPKESVKEYELDYVGCLTPKCRKRVGKIETVSVLTIYKHEFMGFLYADGTIEADFKRMRNGQVEWATKVRVKQ